MEVSTSMETVYVVDFGDCTRDSIVQQIGSIQDMLNRPECQHIHLKVDDSQFPGGLQNMPQEMRNFLLKEPRVKVILNSQWSIVREFLQSKVVEIDGRSIPQLGRSVLDMTAVSAFYSTSEDDARRTATLNAMKCWMKQRFLPKEFLFIELGFDGRFMFDDADFPPNVQYLRIDGTSANKNLFQKEHLWNIGASIAGHDRLMFMDSDMSPIDDCSWFKQAYDVLDECLFAQGFKTLRYLDEKQRPSSTVKLSMAASKCMGIEMKSPSQFNPGGVYCISRKTLAAIGGFNYLPLGGGDALFWHEMEGGTMFNQPWNVLAGRDDVRSRIQSISAMSKKNTVGFVDVEICHFHHGPLARRSYGQRHYMLMTQYPWDGRLVMEDENNLAKWVEPNGWFAEAAGRMKGIMNKESAAAQVLSSNVLDYAGFVKGVNLLRGSSRSTMQDGILSLQCRCMKPDSLAHPLVSVVVPCYNVEQYIDQCLNSILDNGYSNIEVICVDDRSTDSTVERIQNLMKKHPRIRLLRNETDHQLYGGGCRNIGLDHASGKYIYFCDSDDYILPGLLKECVDRCESLGAEVCGFQFTAVNASDSSQYYRYHGIDPHLLNSGSDQTYNRQTSRNIFNVLFSAPWNRVYLRKFIERNHIRFQEIRHSNDNLWHVAVMSLAERITHIEKVFYVYRKNTEHSVQKAKNSGSSLGDTLSAWKKSWMFARRIKDKRVQNQFEEWLCKEMVQVRNHVKYDAKFLKSMRRFVEVNFPFSRRLIELCLNFDRPDVIVSFATYSARLGSDEIYKFIDGLLNQRCECKYKVVANMWEEDYKNAPDGLKKYLEEKGVEVCTDKFNYMSNNKYIHVMQKYRDIPIITVDDDQVYSSNMVQTLYSEHLKNPDMILCGCCRRIKFDETGRTRPYSTWKRANETTPSIDLIPIGVGGVLYPLRFTRLISEGTGKKVVKMGLLTRDDIFLHWLSSMHSILVKKVYSSSKTASKLGSLIDYSLSTSDDDNALYKANLVNGENNQDIHLFDKVKEHQE